MPIFVDDRVGSKELASLFPVGISIELTRMAFGDFAFIGNGPLGPSFIGVERKTIRDLVASMDSGRLSGHQLIGLKDTYSWVYLILEGIWRTNPATGILEERYGAGWHQIINGTRRYMGREVTSYLNTMTVKTGVIVVATHTKTETVQTVCMLNSWWAKKWNAHTSHLQLNKAGRGEGGETSLTPPTLLRRIAAELPGIGWGKSIEVEKHFKSVAAMVNAEVTEWMEIPGIGEGIADKVVRRIE